VPLGLRTTDIVAFANSWKLVPLIFFCRSSSVLPDAVAGLVQAPSIDRTWVENTSKHATSILEKLDIDLKNYKSNSIKESIRYIRCAACPAAGK